MLTEMGDWLRLQRLRFEAGQITRKYRRAYSKLDPANESEVVPLLESLSKERLANGLKIEEVKTGQLLRLAEKHDIPVPPILFRTYTLLDLNGL